MVEYVKDPYGLDYENPYLLSDAPDRPARPEDKLTISPLGVLLEQRLTGYKNAIADWCVENRFIVAVICVLVVFLMIYLLRAR